MNYGEILEQLKEEERDKWTWLYKDSLDKHLLISNPLWNLFEENWFFSLRFFSFLIEMTSVLL